MTLPLSERAAREAPGPERLNEHDRVALTESVVSEHDQIIPAGSVGTIVNIWKPGEAFDVEFSRPEAIVMVRRHQISLHTRLER